MPKPDFSIKRGDTLPVLRIALQFEDETPFDLTGRVAADLDWNFQVFDRSAPAETGAGTFTIVIAAATATTPAITPADGIVDYAWAAGDTDAVNRFRGEVELDTGSGRITFPNGSDIIYDVVQDLADAP